MLFFRYCILYNVATACSIPRFAVAGCRARSCKPCGSQLATAGPATGKRGFYCGTATFIMLLFNKKE